MSGGIDQQLQRLWPRLYGYAVALTASHDRAQDALQEVALKALAAAKRPKDEPAIRAWLFAILRNAVIDESRRARRSGVTTDRPGREVPETGTPWSFDDRMIAEITVREALGRIDPIYRDVIALVDVAGFAYAEAAAIVGIPVGTVMSRVSRGRAAMLEVIEGTNLRSLPAKRGSR